MRAVGRHLPLLLALVLGAGCMDYGFFGSDAERSTPRDTGALVVDTDPPDTDPPDTDPPDTDPPDTDPPDTDPPEPDVGCADGSREGFLSLDDYPWIAGCAGAWSEGGVTVSSPVPLCGRAAGNHGSNPEGAGCASADVCAEGWHVCEGKTEVGELAGSCADAVPPGAPAKSLFFAVSQQSQTNSVCDDAATNGNDVFGCGNLGTELSPERDCGALDRVLASMHSNTCGFNEAEPNLGPWECAGDDESHLHEGQLVTKKGCPGASCSYDGYPVGNSDKGGVLCCVD